MTFRLQLPDHWKIHPSFHISLLKLHHGDPRPEQAPVFTVDGQDSDYEIERIVGHRLAANGKW